MKDKIAQTATARLTDDLLQSKIYEFRGQKVMLDRDLAELYGVETRVLKQAVRRNMERFPEDFMFEMTTQEFAVWRSQSVISKDDKQGLRYAPFCFTEQGVAMLSSVLKSKLAISINIQIMRVFTRMRQLLTDNMEIKLEIAQIKNVIAAMAEKQQGQNQNIELLFAYIYRLQEQQESDNPAAAGKRKKIGYAIAGGNDKS